MTCASPLAPTSPCRRCNAWRGTARPSSSRPRHRAHATQPRELRGVRRRAPRRGPGRAHLRHDDGARRWRGGRAHARGAGPPPDPAVDSARLRRAAPDRVVRAIVLARLANFVDGHAAVRAEVATEVAGMLGSPLPEVPGQGNGGAGEIVALGRLFYDLSARLDLEPKERMALINGSPCAAALVGGCRARRAGAPGARREACSLSPPRLPRRRSRPTPRTSRPCGATSTRRPRCGRCARLRRFGPRPPGAPGRGELPHPAAGARPGCAAHRPRPSVRRRCRCARSPTTRSTSCPMATARSGR